MVGLDGRAVLVTGASGFIGQHLLHRLLQEAAHVWILTRSHSSDIPDSVNQVVAALQDLNPLTWRELELPKFDIVYHLGAYTPKDSSSANNLDRCFVDNVLGTRQLLDSISPLPSKVVLASTLDVYAPTLSDEVIDESSRLGPSTFYGSSKLFAESYLHHWARGVNVPALSLRYGHIYGPGEGAYRKLIPETIRRVLQGEPPAVEGDGTAMRDFLYIDDAVEATLRAGFTTDESHPFLNIVRGESVSVREIVGTLAELAGISTPIRYRSATVSGRNYFFDNSRMLGTLGSWPFVPLRTGLRNELDAMQSSVESSP